MNIISWCHRLTCIRILSASTWYNAQHWNSIMDVPQWLCNGWPYQGKLHHHYLAQHDNNNNDNGANESDIHINNDNAISLPWDACFMFNPGIGHDNVKNDWNPTMHLLLATVSQTRRSCHSLKLLFTAHLVDATRDASILLGEYNSVSETSLYNKNHFASRITCQDPFDNRHVIRPNENTFIYFEKAQRY